MNTDILSYNLLNSSDITDIRSFSPLVDQYSLTNNPIVVEYQSPGEMWYQDKWPYPSFNYSIHQHGYRFENIPNEVDIAAFGCSFTFGQGLSSDMIWHHQLANSLGKTVINFGLPGLSIESVIDLFLIASKHINIKHAIFLLPTYTRKQIAKINPKTNKVQHVPILPNLPESALAKYYCIDVDAVYRALPDEELLKIAKNKIYLAEYIGKLRGVTTCFSSWDPDAYDMLHHMSLKDSVLLPRWQSANYDQLTNDLARDGKHPGPEHHRDWASHIIDYIK
jgi:hypothetical protein